MNGKQYAMSWIQDDVPPGMMPGRSLCADPHSIGIEKREGRYVFGFEIPSRETKSRLYHVSFDPVTREIFHQCIATQTRYCSKRGIEDWGPHTVDRPFPRLCRHSKVVKRWAAKNRVALAETVETLRQMYEREDQERRTA